MFLVYVYLSIYIILFFLLILGLVIAIFNYPLSKKIMRWPTSLFRESDDIKTIKWKAILALIVVILILAFMLYDFFVNKRLPG